MGETTKRERATNAEMEGRLKGIVRICWEIQPCTVRQVFYQASIRGLVDKTEQGYRKIQQALVTLRDDGLIPLPWIVDFSRIVRAPTTFASPLDALDTVAKFYRVDTWQDEAERVLVFIEKDALTGVILPVTDEYGVPLLSLRGYSSISFLDKVAEGIRRSGRPTFVYHLGDWDPSGQDAARAAHAGLTKYAPEADITFIQLAVSPSQIVKCNLPSRPTKESDSRTAQWLRDGNGDSVELDSINPNTLRQMVTDAIEQHIVPEYRLEMLLQAEEDQQRLREIADQWSVRSRS
ncbi:hypothetical protein [Rhodopila sp.]|uniref:hypothetical protein n=1 Tax=Rhodopila sp. TaxID=2480087 RepID=UPI003D139B7F